MNKNMVLMLAVSTLSCLLTASPFALATPTTPLAPPTTTLDTDKRLERLVSVSGVGVSLSEIASELSDKTLTLSTDSSCADQKIQLRVRNQPLRSVMASLAHLLPGAWEASDTPGRGYGLSMSREAQANRARWWATFLEERDQELAFQRQQVLQSMQDPAATTPPDPAEGNGGAIEADRGQRFFNSLPAHLQAEVAEQMDDAAFYQCSSTISTSSGSTELATVIPEGSLSSGAQRLVKQALESREVPPARSHDLGNASVVFANDGLGVFANLLSPDGHDLGNLFLSHAWQGAELPGLFLNQSDLPAFVDQNASGVPPAWQILADYQRRRFWKNDAPKPSAKPLVTDYPPTRTVDWLARVGDKTGIDYIADYYSLPQRVMTAQEMAAPLAGPLKQELDTQAIARDISWKKTGNGLYLFRNNRWYRDDELEVPNSVLAQIKVSLPQPADARTAPAVMAKWPDGPAGLKRQIDAEADVLARLSPWQIANGLAHAIQEPADDAAGRVKPPRPEETNSFTELGHRVMMERNTLEFYAGLSDEERSQLIFHSLPAGALDPAQGAFAVALAPQLAARLAAPAEDPPFGAGPASALLGIRRMAASGDLMVVMEGQSEALRLFVSPPPTDGTAPTAPAAP